MKAGALLIVVILALALGGLAVYNLTRPQDDYWLQSQRARLAVEKEQVMSKVDIAFRIALAIVFMLFLSGAGWGVVKWAHKRASTVYPDRETGIFPIIWGKIGRATYYHDPNRAPTPTTVYSDEHPTVQVLHVTADVSEGSPQHQITSQAQATQLAAAATRKGLTAQAVDVIRAITARRGDDSLPAVTVSKVEPTHVERLLEEYE